MAADLTHLLSRERQLLAPDAQREVAASQAAQFAEMRQQTRDLIAQISLAEDIDFLSAESDLWDAGNTMCAMLCDLPDDVEVCWSGDAEICRDWWTSDQASASTCCAFRLGSTDGPWLLAAEFPAGPLARIRETDRAVILTEEGEMNWAELRQRLTELARERGSRRSRR